MKYITLINLFARFVFVCLIFGIVREESDYLYVPLLNGVGALIGGIIGLYVLFVKDRIIFKLPTYSKLWNNFKESAPLFASNAIISVKDRFNIIFIGSSLGMAEVAIYDLAVKIMGLFMQPIDTINATIYPKMAKEKNMRFLFKVSKITFLIVLILVVGIQPFLSFIIDFLGKGLTEAVTPTRILLIAPLLMVWSLSLGRNCLIVHNKYRIFTLGMFLTTLFYLVLISVAFYLNLNETLYTFVAVTIAVYLFELAYRYIAARRLGLLTVR